MRKVLICLLALLTSMGASVSVASAQEQPPNPSCTVSSIDGLTLTLEIADMRPGSTGEIQLFNGIYYYDDDDNLTPNPFGADELDNGIHQFTLIPGEWSLSFSEWTSDNGFIIGWGCDTEAFVIGAVDPATALRTYLADLLASGDLSDQQHHQLITQLDRAEEAIARGNGGAANAHLNNLTRRADHKSFGLDAGQVDMIESFADEIASGLA